jgi:magnesium-transporting ATPase (P-type)
MVGLFYFFLNVLQPGFLSTHYCAGHSQYINAYFISQPRSTFSMHTNKPVKIFIGLLTFFEVIFPFVIMPVFMLLFFVIIGASSSNHQSMSDSAAVEKVIIPMMIFYTGMMCFGFVQFALKIFYIVHEIKNKLLTDNFKILFVLGTFLLPYLAMPIYFFAYLWNDNLQDSKTAQTQINA